MGSINFWLPVLAVSRWVLNTSESAGGAAPAFWNPAGFGAPRLDQGFGIDWLRLGLQTSVGLPTLSGLPASPF